MKERPILFSTPMVQAILEGRKTMTRRTKGLQVLMESFYPNNWVAKNVFNEHWEFYNTSNDRLVKVKCPYGKPGDVLWVREKFRRYCHVDENGYTDFDKEIIQYAADSPELMPMVDADGWLMFNKDGSEKFVPWKPSIHMPKEACRLRLLIKSIRVERLQDITYQDAISEGIYEGVELEDTRHELTYYQNKFGGDRWPSSIHAFCDLWQSINGPGSWEANPWVWVIEFEKIN